MNDGDRRRAYRGPRLFSQGFRPLFLAASVWAALAQAAWLWMLGGGLDLSGAFSPTFWHIHEMMFGFVVAAIAGFMLTAIPNWTGRLPVRGVPLMFLCAAWLTGRAAVAASDALGAGPVAAIDLTFLAAFLAIVTRELVAGKNWRNLPMAAALAVLSAANLAMHAEAAGWLDLNGASWRSALAVFVMLISVSGGPNPLAIRRRRKIARADQFRAACRLLEFRTSRFAAHFRYCRLVTLAARCGPDDVASD